MFPFVHFCLEFLCSVRATQESCREKLILLLVIEHCLIAFLLRGILFLLIDPGILYSYRNLHVERGSASVQMALRSKIRLRDRRLYLIRLMYNYKLYIILGRYIYIAFCKRTRF